RPETVPEVFPEEVTAAGPMAAASRRKSAMRPGIGALWVVCVILLGTVPGRADRRVALVIGNSNYIHAGQLANPVNDGAAVAALLKRSGFDVVEPHWDLGVAEMRRAISDFSDVARDSDIAVVYYAGHGIEV